MDSLDEIEGFEDGANARETFRLRRDKRQAPDCLEQAHFGERGFYGDRIRFHEVDVHQRKILEVEAAGLSKIAGECGSDKAGHFRWNFRSADGDQAATAESNEWKRQGVVAGQNQEILTNEVEVCPHWGVVAGGL